MALDTPLTYGVTMTIAQLSSPFILFNTTLTLLTLKNCIIFFRYLRTIFIILTSYPHNPFC